MQTIRKIAFGTLLIAVVMGMACATHADMYVSNTVDWFVNNGNVEQFGLDGTDKGAIYSNLNTPSGIAVTNNSDIYVSLLGNCAILAFHGDGSFFGWYDTPGIRTTGLAKGTDGDFYVGTVWFDKILKCTPSGVVSTFVDLGTTNGGFTDTLWGSDGKLYAGRADDKIMVFNADGTTNKVITGCGNCQGLDFGPDGCLYATSWAEQAGKIIKYNGTTWSTFIDTTSSLVGVGDVDWGPDGNIYVANYHNCTVTSYNSSGALVRTFTMPAGNHPAFIDFNKLPDSLSVTITLQDYNGDLTLTPVKLQVLQDASVVAEKIVTPIATTFTSNFASLSTGNYTVRATGAQFLARSANVTISNGTTTATSLSLPNGDLNGDGSIGTTDFSILSSNFDKVAN